MEAKQVVCCIACSIVLRRKFGIPSMALFHTMHIDFAEQLAAKPRIANFTEKLDKYVLKAEKDFGHMSPTYISIAEAICTRKDIKPLTGCDDIIQRFREAVDVLSYRDIVDDVPQMANAMLRPMLEENILITGELYADAPAVVVAVVVAVVAVLVMLRVGNSATARRITEACTAWGV